MAFFIGLLLVLFSIGVILYPFLKGRRVLGGTGREQTSLDEVLARRASIYEDIDTLELEHALGSVSDDEYRIRLDGYRLAAANTYRQQELLQSVAGAESQAIEEEVLRLRSLFASDPNHPSCPACGRLLTAGAVRCSHCGAQVDQLTGDQP